MQLCGRRVATPYIRSEPHMLRECFDHVIVEVRLSIKFLDVT
jgi:hypothetical protein